MRVPLLRCGLVRTAVGRLAVAAKASVIGSECRNGGSVNPKRGSTACRTWVYMSYVPAWAARSVDDVQAGQFIDADAAALYRRVPGGIHTSGSNSPRIITSSGAGSASGLVVNQPRC
jgi:hypothetical protein